MLVNVLLGVIVSIALTLSGFALNEIYNMNAEIALLQDEVKHEQRVRRTLKMHWKLHRWAHDEVNSLRSKSGLDNARWPDLGGNPLRD